MRKIRAAVIQTVSGTDPAANTAAMRRLVRQAAEQGADWALLPEYWPLMGQNDRDKLALAEPFGSGTLQQAMAETAAECGVTLFGGTIPLQSPVPGKVWNSLLAYDKNGECVGRYDKMHLFGYSGLGERYAEADTIAAGREVPHLTTDGWNLAQGICYDLRFPDLYHRQGALGTAAARPCGGKPMLRFGGRTGRPARKRPPHLRPQHDYRPLGRNPGRAARRGRRDYRRTRPRAAEQRAAASARTGTPHPVIPRPSEKQVFRRPQTIIAPQTRFREET